MVSSPDHSSDKAPDNASSASRTKANQLSRLLLLTTVVLLTGWVRLLPLQLAPIDDYVSDLSSADTRLAHAPDWQAQLAESLKSQLEYDGDDHHAHVYLGDEDSYYWLRLARNLERKGSVCDSIVNGRCWDTLSEPPTGRVNQFRHSLHVYCVAGLHRLLTHFVPNLPLPAAAFLVPVVAGMLGAIPAFMLGVRLGGNLAGVAASLLIGLNPLFLSRSIGSDDDVWSVVLPVFIFWLVVRALDSNHRWRQIAWALAGAIVLGTYAGVWRGWLLIFAVISAGILAALSADQLRRVLSSQRLFLAPARSRLGLVLAVFSVGGMAATIAVTGSVSWLNFRSAQELSGYRAGGTTHRVALWPDAFTDNDDTNIQEVRSLDFPGIADAMGARVCFVIAIAGLFLLALSPNEIPSRASSLAAGGAAVFTLAIVLLRIPPIVGVAAVSILIVAANVVGCARDHESDGVWRALSWIIAAWFIAGLVLSLKGERFVLMGLPAMGFGVAAAIGGLHRAVKSSTVWFSSPRSAEVIVAAAALAAITPQILSGYSKARNYMPPMNDAWWDSLTRLRNASPQEAMVISSLDYGYWIEFIAERRAVMDGGSVRNHALYWLSKALFAPTEEQSVGLLRMLACSGGGDTGSALGKLRADGVNDIVANDTLMAIAALDSQHAREYLERVGLTPSAINEVLPLTHCSPPASYLILSSSMIDFPAMRRMGNWDLRRALASRLVGEGSTSSDPQTLLALLGPNVDSAHKLLDAARAQKANAVDDFIAPSAGYISEGWLPCLTNERGELECPMKELHDLALSANANLHDIVIRPGTQPGVVLRLISNPDAHGQVIRSQAPPGTTIVAKGNRLTDRDDPNSPYPDLAVLFDADHHRVLAGPPALIRSTFTRLMFLGPGYLQAYEKQDEQRGYAGERVETWKINWNLR